MKTVLIVAAASLLAVSSYANAAAVASDNANNVAVYGNTFLGFGGKNGGTGFGAWNVIANNGTGTYSGQFLNNIDNTGAPQPVFAVYADVGSNATAYRPLTGGNLSVGQTVTFSDMVLNDQATGGNGGVALYDTAGNALLRIYAVGGTNIYTVDDAIGTNRQIAGSTYNYHSKQTFAITLGAAGAYSLVMTGNSNTTFAGTISNPTGVAQIGFFDLNGGGSSDVFVAGLSVTTVPEPMSLGLIAGGAGLLLRRRR